MTRSTAQKNKRKVYVILHNIRSVHNVGALFRTADAVGVSKIFTTGYTPTPFDRFGRERKDFAKTALGAEKTVPHEHREDISDVITKLRSENVSIISIEQDEQAQYYKQAKIKFPCAFIFGNEVDGIEKKVLEESDMILEVPMAGKKESLNVAVTAGIILFHFLA